MCKKFFKLLALASILLLVLTFVISCQMPSNADYYEKVKGSVRPWSVTYDLNGGTLPPGVKNPDSFDLKSNITLYSPSKTGYTFDGWFDPYGKKITVLDKSLAFEDLTLKAKFTPIVYTITYYLYRGTNNADNPLTYTIEDEIELAIPTKDKRIFKGWFTTSARNGTPVTKIEKGTIGNKNFYARWKVASGEIFDIDDEGIGNLNEWITEAINTSETDNVIAIAGDATTSELKTLSSQIVANSQYIEEIDLSELNVTTIYSSSGGAMKDGFLSDLKNVKRIVVPESLQILGEGAFCYCENLEEVVLNEGLTDILWSAFCYCYKLKEITIPDSVVFIAQTCFYECFDLEHVHISKNSNLEILGAYSFYHCTSLIDFYVPPKVTYLDNRGATGSRNGGVTYSGAFTSCTALSSVTFSKTLTKINEGTFEGCNNITTINYEGTPEEWALVDIGDYNGSLLTATVNYNYEIPY